MQGEMPAMVRPGEGKLTLTGDAGSLVTHLTLCFGQVLLRRVSADYEFADSSFQFEVRRQENGHWILVGNEKAVNVTLVNGRETLGRPTPLCDGDEISLGRRGGRSRAMRITVRCAETSITPVDVARFCVGLSEEEKELHGLLVPAWRSFCPAVDLTDFVLRHGWSTDRIAFSMRNAKYNHPELFQLANFGRFLRRRDGAGRIVGLMNVGTGYDFPMTELPRRQAELDAAVALALDSVRTAKTPLERALGLHDYIVRTCQYDKSAAAVHDKSRKARTVYSVLVRHLAVCEGYTLAYRYLLNAVGILSEEVISKNGRHVWNLVRLDGVWYHVDVTWDDPVGRAGRLPDDFVSHRHFLMSDRRARATGHAEWDMPSCSLVADDGRYDHVKWEET